MVTLTQPGLHTDTHPLALRELPADLETPVSVFLKLSGEGPSFLLESVTGGEQVARYSFIGVGLSRAYLLRGDFLEIHPSVGPVERLELKGDPLEALRQVLQRDLPFDPGEAPRLMLRGGLPRFTGGLAGYLGYDLLRYFEPSIPIRPHKELPEAVFLLADTLVAFDHAYGRLVLLAHSLDGSQQSAEARLDEIENRLSRQALPGFKARQALAGPVEEVALTSNFTRQEFVEAVLKAKEHIAAGDIFQVVLSQRLSRRTRADPFSIYRALRRLNPSPYMFYFDFDGLPVCTDGRPLRLIGASPEMHVRLENSLASVRPIAGTRMRGANPAADLVLEAELIEDPKERAEHVMLVDLARNDLGRVCAYGSIRVPEQMVVERYSHVMHIVSHVEGRLRPGLDAFDLMRATFPAGTVSGAPKVRAGQIIAELEKEARGPYAGATGYFSNDGSMDTCITIRTLVMQGDSISIQAGAGIVADSDPDNEYQETLNKANALLAAVASAEQSL